MEVPIFCVPLHPRLRKTHKTEQIGAVVQLVRISACHAGGRGFESRPHRKREHSSVGLEHLPYKQRVGGSTPSAPTRKDFRFYSEVFFIFLCCPQSAERDVDGLLHLPRLHAEQDEDALGAGHEEEDYLPEPAP